VPEIAPAICQHDRPRRLRQKRASSGESARALALGGAVALQTVSELVSTSVRLGTWLVEDTTSRHDHDDRARRALKRPFRGEHYAAAPDSAVSGRCQ